MTTSLIGVEKKGSKFASLSDDTQRAPITNAACADHGIAQQMYVRTYVLYVMSTVTFS